MTDDDRTARERLLDELTQERWAPKLPAMQAQPRAGHAPDPAPEPRKRRTGTGWPA